MRQCREEYSANGSSMNLLLTSIGKRIELIEHLKSRFRVIGADASGLNAAKRFVDSFYHIPKCHEDGYVDALLSICEREAVLLLVPLYEPEFEILDGARARFEKIGVKIVLSDRVVLNICDDKRRTAAFFEKYGLSAPRTYSLEEVEEFIEGRDAEYPFIIKPVNGMGSEGIFFARNRKELAFFYEYAGKALVQKCVEGREYTVDVLCDFFGEPVYIVPRVRLEVLSGEVSKSRVDLRGLVIEETKRLLEALNKEGGVCGPMTIQCFLSEDGRDISFIEINPRFGGGVPLSFAAGGDYAGAIEKMGEGLRIGGKDGGLMASKTDLTSFRNGELKELTMLRYTQAVYE